MSARDYIDDEAAGDGKGHSGSEGGDDDSHSMHYFIVDDEAVDDALGNAYIEALRKYGMFDHHALGPLANTEQKTTI